jgi:hypothetical protein
VLAAIVAHRYGDTPRTNSRTSSRDAPRGSHNGRPRNRPLWIHALLSESRAKSDTLSGIGESADV